MFINENCINLPLSFPMACLSAVQLMMDNDSRVGQSTYHTEQVSGNCEGATGNSD